MKTINYAIDLGTTNSLIAKYNEGAIKIYNNPIGLKQTLPSCIAFRGNRTVIGDKALDYLEKDSENVCMLFKRKMGTEDVYSVPALDSDISPIELSSLILKELKNNFVLNEETFSSVVITIPASFDTIQSNATKKAGYMAGFKEVVLLQEPIAACLAFANTSGIEVVEKQNWVVYDLGGGTFDVALVEVDDRELKVVDNVGDNYLGGADFDNLIVEKIIAAFIEEKLGVSNFYKEVKSKKTKYKGLYFELLKLAEEAKKELSAHQETIIDLDFEVEDKDFYEQLEVSRAQFESLITNKIDETVSFIKDVIDNNGLINSQIEHIILVGGSTYIPLVKDRIYNTLGIKVNVGIDPTTAVVNGAAFYAGSKPATVAEEKQVEEKTEAEDLKIFYEQNTKDLEELITIKLDNELIKSFRIIRTDGGFDTGIKALDNRAISEFVPLLQGRLNSFKVHLLNANLDIERTIDSITINQGSYNIQGQPLPNDICMEVDDLDITATRLEKIFAKGSILPLKKKVYKTASKTILRNSESSIIINIIEGKSNGLPSSGLSIGYIEIQGKDLEDDLIKGTDIEIEVEVSESRDLKVNVFLQSCDQEFKNVFSESERAISAKKMNMEINTVLADIDELIQVNNANENFEYSHRLETIRVGLIETQIGITALGDDDLSDAKFQLDDKKRKFIQDFDDLTRSAKIARELEEYEDAKSIIEYHINKEENERFREKYNRIIQNEKEVVNSGNKYLIRAKIKELDDLYDSVIQSSDENFISHFLGLKMTTGYSSKRKAEKLFKEGDRAIDKKDYKSLRYVVYGLSALLPDYEKEKKKRFTDDSRTGLS